MKATEQIEREYMEFLDQVELDTRRIVGIAGNGRAEDAAKTAAELVQKIRTRKHQYKMQQEQAAGYDLAALSVNASVSSNSETGYEDRG